MLSYLLLGIVEKWEHILTLFLETFSPASRVTSIRREIQYCFMKWKDIENLIVLEDIQEIIISPCKFNLWQLFATLIPSSFLLDMANYRKFQVCDYNFKYVGIYCSLISVFGERKKQFIFSSIKQMSYIFNSYYC